MNVNECPTPGSRVWICLTHCLHAPCSLWTKQSRSRRVEPTNRTLANPPPLCGWCFTRTAAGGGFCYPVAALARSCVCPQEALPSLHVQALCLQGCVCPGTVPPSAVPQAPPARLAGEHGGWRKTAIANIHPEQANPKWSSAFEKRERFGQCPSPFGRRLEQRRPSQWC